MASLVNRLKTIIGSDAGFFSASYRLLFYLAVSNPFAKISNKISSIFKPVKHRKFTRFALSAKERQSIINQIKSATRQPVFHVVNSGNRVNILSEGAFQINYYQTAQELISSPLTQNDFFILLDKGDTVAEDILFCVAEKIIETQAACICFGVEVSGMQDETNQFGWFPHELIQHNYLLNGAVFSGEYIHQIQAQPTASLACYPALLGLAQTPAIINHVLIKKQTDNRELVPEQNLVKQWLKEKDISAEYSANNNWLNYHVKGQPLVSIIIPTRNKTQLVKCCIDSILQKTTYHNYEILLIDNRSDDESLKQLVKQYQSEVDRFRYLRADIAFNFSALINLGYKAAKGDFVLLMNNDTTVITSDWIEKMLGYAQLSNAGAVGCKLLYAEATIQHAGIVVDEFLNTHHIYAGFPRYDNRISKVKNYPAVTAAVLMIHRDKFAEAGGFNEAFAVEFNDIDFCLKLREKGYYNVYLPQVELFHNESASRRHPLSDRKNYSRFKAESALFKEVWKDKINALL